MKFKISKIIDKENLKKAFLFFKNLPWLIGENTFPFFIVMISIAIILGVCFFVRNVVLIANQRFDISNFQFVIERRIPIISSQLPVLDEKAIKGILSSWHFRQDKFDGANSKTYPNLFLPKGE